jgi:hypothetical protein
MFFLRKSRRSKVENEYGEFPFNADALRWPSSKDSTSEDTASKDATQASTRDSTPQREEPEAPLAKAAAAGFEAKIAGGHAPIVHETETVSHGSVAVALPEAGTAKEDAEPEWRAPLGNPAPPATSFWRSRLSLAAVWAIAVGATMWYLNGRSPSSRPRQEVDETRPVTMSNPLGLQVDRGRELLNIVWDRTSATAMNSQGGYMTIRDGDLVKLVRLDSVEIRTGHVYYASRSADIGIRLEVAEEDGHTASESVRVVEAPAISGQISRR